MLKEASVSEMTIRVGDLVRHTHAEEFKTPAFRADLEHTGKVLEVYRGEFGSAARVDFNGTEWRLYTSALVFVDRADVKAPLGLT